MLSPAIATRVGGGDPHSERQRAEHVWPASVQLTRGGPLTTIPCVHPLTPPPGSCPHTKVSVKSGPPQVLPSSISRRVASRLLPWNIGIRYYEEEGLSDYQVVQVGSELQIRSLNVNGVRTD